MAPFPNISPACQGFLCAAFMIALLSHMLMLIVQLTYRIPGRIYRALWFLCLLGPLYMFLSHLRHAPELLIFSLRPLKAPVFVWQILLLAALLDAARGCRAIWRWLHQNISPNSIKEGIDQLPTGICFYRDNGMPLLTNQTMRQISLALLGAPLRNASEFWHAVQEKADPSDSAADSAILCMQDGRVWSFRQSSISLRRGAVEKIIAADITQEYQLVRQLQEQNRQISLLNLRLAEYGKTVDASTREHEILLAKIRIHDDLGKALLASRRCIDAAPEQRSSVLQSWKQTIALFLCQEEAAPANTPLRSLSQAARSIGVTICMEGDSPPAHTPAGKCMVSAAHECLTNAVRHAAASKLYIRISRDAAVWRFQYANDGQPPASPIREGGGLSSLRRRIEGEGGVMKIESSPRFQLTITIPDV